MSNIIITGLLIKNKWKILREQGEWKAWIPDPDQPETGAPILTSHILDELVTQIETFELGAAHNGD